MKEIEMETPPRAAGKRPMIDASGSSSGHGEVSGRIQPNAIVPRASWLTGYMTWAVNTRPGKMAKLAEEMEVTAYATYADPGAGPRKYARVGEQMVV